MSDPISFLTPMLMGPVLAATVVGDSIVVGGQFQKAGGIDVRSIARWDGTNWSAIGSGFAGAVRALASRDSVIYAGGDFGISRWDGKLWADLGAGVHGTVNAISLSGDRLYAGGSFTNAGGKNLRFLAQWNGNEWSSVGEPLDGPVQAITVGKDGIYVGGWFLKAGEKTVNRVAKWNGDTWTPLGEGVIGSTLASVHAFAFSDSGILYAGGDFSKAGSVSATHLAKWSNGQWSSLGSGVTRSQAGRPPVRALAWAMGKLYVGGTFEEVGGKISARFAVWNEPEKVGPALSITANRIDQATVQIRLTGRAGVSFAIEASNDLLNWSSFRNDVLTNGEFSFIADPRQQPLRFFRAQVNP